jgi:hypothetical protein
VELRDGIPAGTEDTEITFLFPPLSCDSISQSHSLADLVFQEEGLVVGLKTAPTMCACQSDLLTHPEKEGSQFQAISPQEQAGLQYNQAFPTFTCEKNHNSFLNF